MTKNSFIKRIGLFGGISCLLLAVGCGSDEQSTVGTDKAPLAQGADDAPNAATPAFDKSNKRARKGRHGRAFKRGPAKLFRKALKLKDLSDAQRTGIEALLGELKPDKKGMTAFKSFHEALADGVAAGNIDDAAITKATEAIDAQMVAKRDKMAKALEQLHKLLSPEQRSALIAKMRKWGDKKGRHFRGDEAADGPEGRRHRRRGGDRARGRKRGGERARGKFGKHGKMGKHGMGKLIKQLDLSEEQREQLRALRDKSHAERPGLADKKAHREAMRAKMSAFGEAFASDNFDAKALAAKMPMGEHMRKRFTHKVAKMKAILPILTKPQREKLAKLLREGPKRFGHRGMRRGH